MYVATEERSLLLLLHFLLFLLLLLFPRCVAETEEEEEEEIFPATCASCEEGERKKDGKIRRQPSRLAYVPCRQGGKEGEEGTVLHTLLTCTADGGTAAMAEENDDDEEEERKRTEEGGKKGFKLGREVGKELRSFPFNLKGGEDVGLNVPSALKVSFQHVKNFFLKIWKNLNMTY